MLLGSSRESGRLRNRLIVAVLAALAGGVAWLAVNRRPQLPQPATEPPRLGYSANGSAPHGAVQVP
ncbi:hypothetical protein [Nocardia pseudobrasiliensis]|uniref:Uncharacterized protein n=1 Tax=Nocardia pseudobrasiliensis TaxID=45979 RepID=A0A370HX90_9NOCA|nr:hypothetical protein [Nocardia pseudobrasiliensis]RDI61574.1 hypothetical protein DFR76_11374 [Nocardia pseudobrasiliensis]